MLVPLRPENIGVLAGAVPLPRGVEIRGFDDAAQVAGALGIAADLALPMAGPEALPERRVPVPVLKCLEFVVAWNRDRLQDRIRLPPAVAPVEGDTFAADLVLQVGQQGQRKALLPVRQIGPVLTDDGRQGAQVPVADRHRSHHEAPPDYVTPAAPVWISAERRIAAGTQARTHWHLKQAR